MKPYATSAILILLLSSQAGAKDPQPLPLEIALQKAKSGKYSMLISQIFAPKDQQKWGAYCDHGYQKTPRPRKGIPQPRGYYVYVYPHWYVWRHNKSQEQKPRRWGPEQVLGEPNTLQAGDIPTAWASKTPDDQEEWLLLEYDRPVVPRNLLVHETYNPGAVCKVSLFTLDGKEVIVWKGTDPTPLSAAKGVSKIPLKAPFKTNRARVYLKSQEVQGWNEIDAVGLQCTGATIQWASGICASSTYASQPKEEVPQAPVALRNQAPQR